MSRLSENELNAREYAYRCEFSRQLDAAIERIGYEPDLDSLWFYQSMAELNNEQSFDDLVLTALASED